MASAGGFPPAVVKSRERLQAGRLKLRAQHDSGSPGIQVSARQADLIDSVVLDLFQAAQVEAGVEDLAGQFAVVAHGGYGRRDVAPFSDVDLMLLHTPAAAEQAELLARYLSRWIVDAGCVLGFSLRTPKQACKYAWGDATIFTSLVESRLLTGSVELFSSYMHSLRKGARRRSSKIIRDVEKARFEERRKYGETVFLLEPNIKRSRGGLRDIQLVRWVGFAKYGECDIEKLSQLGYLDQEDFRVLRDGVRYLLRLRNQMHFEAGKSQDQMDRALQMQLAEWSGFQGDDGILPVEQFMQEYFAHTSEIRYSSAHFLDSAKAGSRVTDTFSMGIPAKRDYRIGVRTVWATPSGLERVKRDPAAVLELMSLSSKVGKPIAHRTWREIRTAMLNRQVGEIDSLTIDRFMELMSRSSNLAEKLRRLHELRVLEQIVPEMAHARCLLQFNQYHKYTVDAHSIRAVECVTELESDKTTLGAIYRKLRDKRILHLALLLHDLGKGFAEDHSEVGLRIAEKNADRLRLNPQDKETLAFLVHKHLLLAHTAFRFDLSNNEAAVKFAAEVGSSERLQLLLLLTYADLASVGPDVVNQWKIELLLQLYYQTDAHFRDEKPGEGFRNDITNRKSSIVALAPKDVDAEWWERQVQALPVAYLLRTEPHVAAREVQNLLQLDSQPSISWGRYIESQWAVEYTVVTKQSGRPIGTFHRITGALSSQGMKIIAAEVHTQPNAVAWDRFLVEDQEFSGPPPEQRIEFVREKINEALDPETSYQPVFPKIWGAKNAGDDAELNTQPTQVRFDNSTSEQHTIITLFAYDRLGLLYSVGKVLFELQLILHSAKISTHLDQVVDVFYVSDLKGKKIEEGTRLYVIRQRLLQAANPDG